MQRVRQELRPVPGSHIEFDYRAQNRFGFGIWQTINEAVNAGRVQPLPQEIQASLGEIVLSISTKIDCLNEALARATADLRRLRQLVLENPDHDTSYAFPTDQRLLRQAILDIDSITYELRSCLDLLERLQKTIDRRIAQLSPIRDLRELLARAAFPETMHSRLDAWRNMFAHELAPWIAADVTDRDNPRLFILLRYEGRPATNAIWFYVEELGELVQSFGDALLPLQDVIVEPLREPQERE